MRASQFFTRREVVQGLAVMPVLGTMLRTSRAAAAGQSPPRFCAMFFGNGVHPSWTPAETGTAFTLPAALAPLEEIRSRVIIVKRMTLLRNANQAHYYPTRAFLTGWNPTMYLNDFRKATPKTASFDQLVADRFTAGPDRAPVHSLQLGVNIYGGTEIAYSTATPAIPLPPERNPLTAYQRLVAKFVPATGGPSAQDQARLQVQLAEGRSVLDGVRGEVAALSRRVSAVDRAQLEAYLTALRSIEDGFATPRISGTCTAAPAAPTGAVLSTSNLSAHPQILRQHMDVIAFAFACGLSRVASLKMSDSELHYPAAWLGQRYESHNLSHYISLVDGAYNKDERIAFITQTTAYFMGQFAYFVKKLAAFPEGAGGTVLDNTLALVASQNGDSNAHSGGNTPYIVAGNSGGRLRPGKVVDAGGRQPNDLCVSLAQAMGLSDVQTFGDPALFRGPLPGLTG